jgi:3-phenylpropionate/trans-cinnamate dioxygenase ferredoxin subunit
MAPVRACAVDEVPTPGALQVELPGPDGAPVAVAVVRESDGTLHAISDTCSHQAVSLSEGEVEDGRIECWLHGSQFDLRTGHPDSLPAVVPVAVYPLTVEGADVLVDVNAPLTTATEGA